MSLLIRKIHPLLTPKEGDLADRAILAGRGVTLLH